MMLSHHWVLHDGAPTHVLGGNFFLVLSSKGKGAKARADQGNEDVTINWCIHRIV
jgi:hypothetical protein